MSTIIDTLKQQVRKSNKIIRIVYPEGWNSSIIEAAEQLNVIGNIKPFLIFKNKSEVPANLKLDHIVIDQADLSKYAKFLYELRKEKGMTTEEAGKLVKKSNFLAALMVKMNEADGEICGIEYTTKDTLKPALQIVKTAKGSKLVSSAFLIEKNDEAYIFSDCSINLNPNSEELVEIAKGAIDFAKNVLKLKNTDTALLSYSTFGSGAGESVDKVRIACETLKQNPDMKDINIYGEIQFDAAFVKSVRTKKAPNIKLENAPGIYIFPNLDSGNIGYKIAQRMGGYSAVGPALINLAAPVNDLSRGAGVNDIINLSYITAMQALAKK